ncbi:2Fe-2S iron-sulfur cluster-binding protein [Streptomyces sp. NPDC020141]|uniref:2Fe-2S iron-sulfur cluster-binding protein n=1 Tax=Streptomyces sp. NPDC020141 TaxID=3365065 RepID=UPI0037B795BD
MSDEENQRERRSAPPHGDRQGHPAEHGGWQPTPQGDYDYEATAFVHIPPEDMPGASPLEAPGHGYVPPMILPLTPAADPQVPDAWQNPPERRAEHAWPEPPAAEHRPEDPHATGEWNYEPPANDVTGQWTIPVARGDLPEETGEFTTSMLQSQWNAAPTTLPGGATAPWAEQAPATLPGGAAAPWAEQPAPAPDGRAPEHHAPAPDAPAAYAPEPQVQELQAPEAHAPEVHEATAHAPEAPAPHAPGPYERTEPAAGAPEAPAAPEPAAQHPGTHAPAPHTPGADAFETRQPLDRAPETPVRSTHAPASAPEPAPRAAAEPEPQPEQAPQPQPVPDPVAPDPAAPDPAVPEPPADPEAEAEAESAARTEAPAAPETAAAAAPGPEPEPDPGPPPAPTPEAAAQEHPPTSYVLRVNGTDRPVTDAWIGESLLYVLRERLGLAGAKDGCSQGECGACNVQVDGRLVASCLVPAATTAGSEVRTVEGLAVDGEPSDVQRALAACGAVQCGFCIPGMAMTVHDLLEGNHRPSELETRQALCGNLCRCSGYRGVLDAVRDVVAGREASAAAAAEAADAAGPPTDARIPHQAPPGAGSVQPHPHDGGMA